MSIVFSRITFHIVVQSVDVVNAMLTFITENIIHKLLLPYSEIRVSSTMEEFVEERIFGDTKL